VRTVLVTVGTLCLSLLLLAVGQHLIFTAWSTSGWNPSSPVESMVFDELVLYTLFPLVVIVGSVVATTLARSRPFAVSMLGTLPVFLGAMIFRRFEIISMVLYVIGYTLLCFSIVKLTDRLWAAKRHVPRERSPHR
jgi:hypothetical protein